MIATPGADSEPFRSHVAVREILKAAVLSRAVLWLAGLLAVGAFGHAPGTGPVPTDELANLPGRWDAGWYLGIASGGYRWEEPDHDAGRIAFFPAYPMALKAVGRVPRLPDSEPPWLWTGVALSTMFFAIGLFYVFRLAAFAGEDAATRAVWLTASYPFSLFYGQVYTESLFLAAAAGAWYLTRRQRYAGAIAWGLVAGLTKPTGCLVAALVLWAVVEQRRTGELDRRARFWAALAIVAPFLGLLAYSGYIKAITGSWLTWMTVQQRWGRESTNLVGVFGHLLAAIREQGLVNYLLSRPHEAANAAAALFAIAAIVPVARRVGLGAGTFVALGILVPLSFGGLLSVGRFTSVLFPIFIWLSTVTRTPAWPVAFGVLQGLFAAMFFTDRPVF